MMPVAESSLQVLQTFELGAFTTGYFRAAYTSGEIQFISTMFFMVYSQRSLASTGFFAGSYPRCVADGSGCLMIDASTAASYGVTAPFWPSGVTTDLPKYPFAAASIPL